MNAPAPPALQAKDFKSDYKPVWCPGCGDYSVLSAVTKALAMLELRPENVAVVSGIGCSSRIPAYTTCYGFHGVHGRSLPAATGLKVARPDLTVLVASGDGDGYSIGGNHFLHACRRNVDLTYIVMDNHVYGMTKGQPSPTTEPDWSSKLAPGGTGLREFHPLVIALASGANFIARASPAIRTAAPRSSPRRCATRASRSSRSSRRASPSGPSSAAGRTRCTRRRWRHRRPGRAARRIMTDDGFNIGVLYKGKRPVYAAPASQGGTVEDLENFPAMKTKPKPSQYADFMSRAYTMELEATERYAQFAEQLETHNNREVAQLFRKLAEIEKLHAKRILEEMNGRACRRCRPPTPGKATRVPRPRRSIAALPDAALARARDRAALRARGAEVLREHRREPRAEAGARRRARDGRRRAEHVRLIKEWMKRVPRPRRLGRGSRSAANRRMKVLLPPGWKPPVGYANGIESLGHLVFVAGQVGWNAKQVFESKDSQRSSSRR